MGRVVVDSLCAGDMAEVAEEAYRAMVFSTFIRGQLRKLNLSDEQIREALRDLPRVIRELVEKKVLEIRGTELCRGEICVDLVNLLRYYQHYRRAMGRAVGELRNVVRWCIRE